MALYLDIAPGEEVSIGAETIIRVDRKDRRRMRLGVTVGVRESIEIRIGETIITACQEGRRVQLKLEADRSIPIQRGKHGNDNPGSGGPPNATGG